MGDDTNSWCSLGFAEPSAAYTSATQQARHLTEGWMAGHGFCPACPADRLPPLPNNTRVGDFRCAACGEEYELKSGQGAVAGVLPAGAWGAMKQRLAAANNPSLFVMGYDRAAHRVRELIVVPRHFFTEAIIRPRAPLGPDARRAGWQGCTIRLKDVPAAGRIPLIRHGAQDTVFRPVSRRVGVGQVVRHGGLLSEGVLGPGHGDVNHAIHACPRNGEEKGMTLLMFFITSGSRWSEAAGPAS